MPPLCLSSIAFLFIGHVKSRGQPFDAETGSQGTSFLRVDDRAADKILEGIFEELHKPVRRDAAVCLILRSVLRRDAADGILTMPLLRGELRNVDLTNRCLVSDEEAGCGGHIAAVES